MMYKHRILRRLWKVQVFTGDPDDPGVEISEETVIAFNAVEAVRRVGRPVALPPEPVCYVTWDDAPLRIENTAGPTDEVVTPSIE